MGMKDKKPLKLDRLYASLRHPSIQAFCDDVHQMTVEGCEVVFQGHHETKNIR